MCHQQHHVLKVFSKASNLYFLFIWNFTSPEPRALGSLTITREGGRKEFLHHHFHSVERERTLRSGRIPEVKTSVADKEKKKTLTQHYFSCPVLFLEFLLVAVEPKGKIRSRFLRSRQIKHSEKGSLWGCVCDH